MINISVITNCHKEGRLLDPTIKSVNACIEMARKNNISIEWIIIRDNPDKDTIEYFDFFGTQNAHILDVNFKNPGLARNHGISFATGRYVSLIDGDDLWGKNWLIYAYEKAEIEQNKNVIWHPEHSISFEKSLCLWKVSGSDDHDFNPNNLLFSKNYWSISSFSHKDTYTQIPFSPGNIEAGFGHEDWHWNCETTASGFKHKIVPNTIHCYRSKSWQKSHYDVSSKEGCIIPPTNLLSAAYTKQICEVN